MKIGRFTTDAGVLSPVLSYVDDIFGPIYHLACQELVVPEPRWWVCTAKLARAPIGAFLGPHCGVAGTSIARNEAISRALGEAIERYTALNAIWPNRRRMDIADGIYHSLPKCSNAEPCSSIFKHLPPGTVLCHDPMKHLFDDSQAQVPSSEVDLGFVPEPPEILATLPISTGLAFRPELHSAIWSGLCEVAERDAMMIMWWNRIQSPEIDCTGPHVSDNLAMRMHLAQRVGLNVRFFDITTDFRVPTVFCIVTSNRVPFVTVGAACRSDPEDACAKSLDEAISIRAAVKSRPGNLSMKTYRDLNDVNSLEDHALLYASHRDLPDRALGFLLNNQTAHKTMADLKQKFYWREPCGIDDLRNIARQMKLIGLNPYWTEIKSSEMEEFGFVVKVVVPEMVPLSQDHRIRWLDSPRLRQFSQGVLVNDFPHPFC